MSELFEQRTVRESLIYTQHIHNNNLFSSSSGISNKVPLQNYPMHLQSATDESEDTQTGAGTNLEEEDEEEEDYGDSGHEDDEDLGASEEILLPEEEDEGDEEDDDEGEGEDMGSEDEDKLFKRQMSYPPLPMYVPPGAWKPNVNAETEEEEAEEVAEEEPSTSARSRRSYHPRERLGVLTPMEEVTEPPSSAGTEASHRSRKRTRNKQPLPELNSTSDNNNSHGFGLSDSNNKKSILKSVSPTRSPERRVKFVGAGSVTPSERTMSPTESVGSVTSEYSSLAVDSGRKSSNLSSKNGNDQAIPEETEEDNEEEEEESDNNVAEHYNINEEQEDSNGGKDGSDGKKPSQEKVMEHIEKVQTWQLGSDNAGDEPMSTLDMEFASILDDIIAELHSWDRLAGTGAGVTEINASRQDHLANVSSQLATFLGQVSPPTVMTNLPQLIPLVTTLLSVTEMNFRAQLTSLNTVNVFIDRLRDCKTYSGMKVLPNADLTWLIRTLCDISSESSRSVLKSEGTTALAKLVKAAGPEMICEPILFILMGNDEKIIKKRLKGREGSGNIVTTGVPGGAPKIKATALDTLTFALLTFPRDDFDLDVVAKLACHCLLHVKRRVRQAALECLSVVSHALGANVALPLFRQFILEEEEELSKTSTVGTDNASASNSSISSEASGSGGVSGSGSASSTLGSATATESSPERPSGLPSRIPVPISKLPPPPVVEVEVPPSAVPIRPKGGPSPASAISARVSRHILPTPSLEELVEYAVKIPAKCQVLSRQNVRIGSQRGKTSGEESEVSVAGSGSGTATSGSGSGGGSGSERLSSSGESTTSSISNIDYALLELEPVLSSKGSGTGQRRRAVNGGGPDSKSLQELAMAPDIAWILSGTGPIKKYDPATLPKELPQTKNKAGGLTATPKRNQQRLPALGNSSGAESDLNNSSGSQRSIGIGSSSDFNNMRRIDRNNLLQDTLTTTDPGRYYYPPSHLSPRGGIGSSDSLSSRLSSKSSFSLLPNKYSIMKSPPYAHPNHDLMPHHSLLPGAYEHPFGPSGDMMMMNSYSSSSLRTPSSWSNGTHSDFGNLTRLPSKANALQPITTLREKFFDASRRNGGYNGNNSFQSADSQSATTEDDEEEESEESEEEENETEVEEKNVNQGQRNQNVKNGIKTSTNGQRNGNNNNNGNGSGSQVMTTKNGEQILEDKSIMFLNKAQDEFAKKKSEELAKGVNREFQVYHHQIEVEHTGHVATAALQASIMKKRGDVDSAGSTNTRDSGVSLGSFQGNKTPPSIHTTPPSIHRQNSGDDRNERPSAGQRLSNKSKQAKEAQLQRTWRSTPDVPHASDTDDGGDDRCGSSRRNHSGSSTHNSNSNFDNDHQPTNQIQAQSSASDGIMLLHKKPVMVGARRGQSVGRYPLSEDTDRFSIPTQPQQSAIPQIRYPDSNNRYSSNGKVRSRQSSHNGPSRNDRLLGSGDRGNSRSNSSSRIVNQGGDGTDGVSNSVAYTYGMDGLSPVATPSQAIRNSVSTGNLDEADDRHFGSGGMNRLNPTQKSKSTYLEINGGDDNGDETPSARGRGRLARRDGGPFGEVRASTEEYISPERKPLAHTLPRRSNGAVNGANGASRLNGKIVPTKVYKGSFREIQSRKAANGSTNGEVFPADLKPVTSPRHALPAALTQLQSTDWETNVDGFRQIVRLIRYNPETIRADLHNVNNVGIKHLTNLRSQVNRSAILCFKELYNTMGKSMESDSEKIAEKLLDKAADTNKFIREDSSKALDAMMANLTPSKGLACLDLFGTRHRNPAVRCMTARMTAKLVQTIGPQRCLAELPERLLPMLCRFLQEGSLETRTMAKNAMSSLMTQPTFNIQLKRHVPSEVLRHAQKSIDSLQK